MGRDVITLAQFDSLASATSRAIKELENSVSSDTSVVAFAVGDTKPANMALWFDTSDYVSVQGETPTYTASIGNYDFVRDTAPTENNVLWFDTTEFESGE